MATLKVMSEYRNRATVYRAGDVLEVDEGLARWLEADAPGTFKRIDAPQVDKMVHRAPTNKAAPEWALWEDVKGISLEVAKALHETGLHTKEDLLSYYMAHGIQALTSIPGVGMKRARDLIEFAQRG